MWKELVIEDKVRLADALLPFLRDLCSPTPKEYIQDIKTVDDFREELARLLDGFAFPDAHPMELYNK